MSFGLNIPESVQLGHDFISFKLYVVAVTALWVYDYALTFADEIRYAWKTKRLLIFVLFLVTRYLPPVFQTWVLITMFYPGYTPEACQKSAYLQVVYYTCITAAAQIVLTQRAYAVSGKDKRVAGILYTIFAVQLGVGIYMSIWSASNSIMKLPPIPLDAYRMCITRNAKGWTVTQISISLLFDIAVFVLVIVQMNLIRSRCPGMSGPGILDRVTLDAKIYFGVMATSHLVVVIMFAVAREGIRALPIAGNAVYIPMMISRMIISLKKAACFKTHIIMDDQNSLPMNLQDYHRSHREESIRLSPLTE